MIDFLIGRVVGDQLLGAVQRSASWSGWSAGEEERMGLNLMGPKIRIMRLRIP